MSVSTKLDKAEFGPGEMVAGCVVIDCKAPAGVERVVVTLKGRQKCHWTKRHAVRRRMQTDYDEIVYEANRQLLDHDLVLLDGPIVLPRGRHTYPFEYTLPEKLLGTMQGTLGNTKYDLVTTVTGTSNHTSTTPFKISPNLDLNASESARNRFSLERSKTIGMFCCSGDLNVTVSLPKRGYTTKEPIKFKIDIDNNTHARVYAVEFEIKKSVKYLATTPRHDNKCDNSTLMKRKFATVITQYSGYHSLNFDVPFPPTDPSTLDNSQVIKVSYEVEVTAKISGLNGSISCSVPIVIGTIPICFEEDVQATRTQPAVHQEPESDPPPPYSFEPSAPAFMDVWSVPATK